MKKNLVKAKLQRGEPAIGSWLNLCSNLAAEFMAQIGWDWLSVDTEHSPVGIEKTIACFQAVCTTNCMPFARVAGNDHVLMKRLLDGGALGLVVPMVNTREEAEHALQGVKFPPQGVRSMGGGRCGVYGADYYLTANDETLVMVQAEHVTAVKNIEDIVKADGIDGCFVGPVDLAASLGIPFGQAAKHPEHEEAIQRVLKVCRNAGKTVGITCVTAEDVSRRVEQGFLMVSCATDHRFMQFGATDALTKIRKSLPPTA